MKTISLSKILNVIFIPLDELISYELDKKKENYNSNKSDYEKK